MGLCLDLINEAMLRSHNTDTEMRAIQNLGYVSNRAMFMS